jgi:hypothetical protein
MKGSGVGVSSRCVNILLNKTHHSVHYKRAFAERSTQRRRRWMPFSPRTLRVPPCLRSMNAWISRPWPTCSSAWQPAVAGLPRRSAVRRLALQELSRQRLAGNGLPGAGRRAAPRPGQRRHPAGLAPPVTLEALADSGLNYEPLLPDDLYSLAERARGLREWTPGLSGGHRGGRQHEPRRHWSEALREALDGSRGPGAMETDLDDSAENENDLFA